MVENNSAAIFGVKQTQTTTYRPDLTSSKEMSVKHTTGFEYNYFMRKY